MLWMCRQLGSARQVCPLVYCTRVLLRIRCLTPRLVGLPRTELMKKHERAFAEIKNYYNDITHNNLDLIKTLKEDVAEMKKREAQVGGAGGGGCGQD